jgi:hypothetical protein
MWDILKDFEAFQIHFERSEGFSSEIRGFDKDFEAFKRHFQGSAGYVFLS